MCRLIQRLHNVCGRLVLVLLPVLVNTAYPQTAPYISDIVGEEGIENSAVKGGTENGELRFIGSFKLFNPDTVPFYLWVSFDNGGKFTHAKYGDKYPTVRLVDLELRYKDASQRPVVKEFPRIGEFGVPPPRRRSAWGSSGSVGVGRFGKKKAYKPQSEVEAESVDRGGRGWRGGVGAVEVVFWQEEVQAYYEMELWGVLYASDLREAVVAGNYVEKIKFEVELAR